MAWCAQQINLFFTMMGNDSQYSLIPPELYPESVINAREVLGFDNIFPVHN
jgi:hypothetical protein